RAAARQGLRRRPVVRRMEHDRALRRAVVVPAPPAGRTPRHHRPRHALRRSRAARLTALLARHSQAMKIYRTGAAARAAMDPLVIVDDVHFVHRHHSAWAHGTLSIGNPERAKALVERFAEIWATGEPGLSANVLGL